MDTEPCIPATASFYRWRPQFDHDNQGLPTDLGPRGRDSLPPRSVETRKRKNLRHPSSPMTDQPWRITFLPIPPCVSQA